MNRKKLYCEGFLTYLEGDEVFFDMTYNGVIYTLVGTIRNIRTITWRESAFPEVWKSSHYRGSGKRCLATPIHHREFCVNPGESYDKDYDTIHPIGYEIVINEKSIFMKKSKLNVNLLSNQSRSTDCVLDHEGQLNCIYIPIRHIIKHSNGLSRDKSSFQRKTISPYGNRVSYHYHICQVLADEIVDQKEILIGTIIEHGYVNGIKHYVIEEEKCMSLGNHTAIGAQRHPNSYEFDPVKRAWQNLNLQLIESNKLKFNAPGYIDGLRSIIDEIGLRRETIRFCARSKGKTDHWYAFTKGSLYIEADNEIPLIFKDKGQFLSDLEALPLHYKKERLNSEDVVFVKKIFGGKKRKDTVKWVRAERYPGFVQFYEFVMYGQTHENFRGGNEKQIIRTMMHDGKHTIWSKLISGFFNKSSQHKEVKAFRQLYCWDLIR